MWKPGDRQLPLYYAATPPSLCPCGLFSGRIPAVSCDYRLAGLLLTWGGPRHSEASLLYPHEAAKLMESRELERCSLRGNRPSHKCCEQGAEINISVVAKEKMREETKLFFSCRAPCQLKQSSSGLLFLLFRFQGHSFRYSPLQCQNSWVSQAIGQQLASTLWQLAADAGDSKTNWNMIRVMVISLSYIL